MLNTSTINDAQKLVNYIQINMGKFELVTQRTPYFHMGATITDSILQAGLNYRYVVYPRVLKLLTKYYEYKTTCKFLILMQTIPLGELINWQSQKKLTRITDLSWFLYNNHIENETEMAEWLNDAHNIESLSNLNGIGPKTIDYLKMLSGNQAIAIDRHLFKFLEIAGVLVNSYNEANTIFSMAASLLNMSKYELDRKIWIYMSKRNYNSNLFSY